MDFFQGYLSHINIFHETFNLSYCPKAAIVSDEHAIFFGFCGSDVLVRVIVMAMVMVMVMVMVVR